MPVDTPPVDVTTLATLQGALRSAVDEMNHVVVRTARSPVFKLAKDFSCSLCDWECRQMVQGRAELPVQVGSIPFVCRATADAFEGDIHPGDSFLCNDPALGGLHLNDVALLQPIFVGSELMFWSVIRAHWQDIGGVAPADLARAQTDSYGEGVRIPPTRIYESGQAREDVTRLLFANLRFADRSRSDLLSMLAAGKVAAQRLTALMQKYGRNVVRAGIEQLYDRMEQQARNAISALPDGHYSGSSWMAARSGTEHIEFKAHVEVAGDHLRVRLDSPPQALDVRNSPFAATHAAVAHAMTICLGIRPPINDGLHRAISVDYGPTASMTNAQVPPAATLGCTTQPFCEIVDCVRAAMSQAITDEHQNAGWAASAATNLFGYHPQTGQFYGHFFPNGGSSGGAGAVFGTDGWSAVGSESNGGAVLLEPVELLEYELPIRMVQAQLRTDSGGAGRWRGGLGLDCAWVPLDHQQTTRFHGVVDTFGPIGVAGAHSTMLAPKLGKRCAIDVDGSVRESRGDSRMHSVKGGSFAFSMPGGGGVGDPFNRDPQAVLADVRDGLVSLEGARRDYRVAIANDGRSVDEPGTQSLRDQ